MKKLIIPSFLFVSLLITSCSDNDDLDVDIPDNQIDVPETYTFERNGVSTVDYNGQTTRIEMANELTSLFTDFENVSDANSFETKMLNMFSNENSPFANADFNASDKSIKSKVAASKDYFSIAAVESAEIKDAFESWMIGQAQEVYVSRNTLASAGVAGQIAQGTRTRYVNGKGLEYNQMFAKSLMGALLADQMLNNYLSVDVLDEGNNRENNDNDVVETDKSYTTMEHKWDEAYGYLFGDASVPQADPLSSEEVHEDRLLFNYLFQVDEDDDFAGIATTIFDAFKKGRAAITQKNYEVRDQQIAIIKENVSMLFAVRAIHYFQAGKTSLANNEMGAAFHELSEGLGFFYSIRFSQNPETNEPYLSNTAIYNYIDQLMENDGFWSVDATLLDEISQEIASDYGITVEMVD
ncbi:DUF4856 domain-containing protein [Mesonia sp. K7]|uniref:DUF4856 domain-containing protein n=1 Tax=Mesonia sp. K7 TaxID=2218606 RepID=UPI000DAA6822|nr:DUF4856 domain-containing protein [Mesonia sp. K7]PZD79490.1 DUF4856 domain-containing protein [Mesonia sp. K7]